MNLESKSPKDQIYFEEFQDIIMSKNFIKNVLENNLIIPQYQTFQEEFVKAHKEIKEDKTGKYSKGVVASYIPSLFKADPKWWGAAFCSSDG